MKTVLDLRNLQDTVTYYINLGSCKQFYRNNHKIGILTPTLDYKFYFVRFDNNLEV